MALLAVVVLREGGVYQKEDAFSMKTCIVVGTMNKVDASGIVMVSFLLFQRETATRPRKLDLDTNE